MQDEKRETETKGGRVNLTWGDDKFNVKFGGAYDEVSRAIVPYDNTRAPGRTRSAATIPADLLRDRIRSRLATA